MPAERASSARIVLTSAFLADYPRGGGHWSWFVQYLLGLRALGHEPFVLELLSSTGDSQRDRGLIRSFFARLDELGFREHAALLQAEPGGRFELESAAVHGVSAQRVRDLARSADFLWNLCGVVRGPLLSLFRRRVLIDTDPGIYQLSAQSWDMGLDEHDAFLTVGTNIGTADCPVPTLERTWGTFRPFVHLPAWPVADDPGGDAPYTSVTHWRWEDEVFEWQGGHTSTSKRAAYLRYLDLPQRTSPAFELAAHIHPLDDTGDRELLRSHGWRLADPEQVADTPERYRRYIQRSRGELACVKPVYSALRTGWFSDRSVCYLATGRPVVCEDTDLRGIPTGQGLLTFSSEEEAVAAVEAVEADYRQHAQAARDLAETLFDARSCLSEMIALSG